MADPRAFISFDFDHNEYHRNLFAGQAKKDSPTPFVVEDWSSKEVLDEKEWASILRDKIGRCHMAIVLVGRHMGTAGGVDKEVAMASEQGVPVFGVYVDGADKDSALPLGLPRSRVVPWDWDRIAEMVDKAMTEKKNKGK
jgi:hypothetical protein